MSLIKSKKRVADHGEVFYVAVAGRKDARPYPGKHDIFKPTGTHPPMTVRELAAQAPAA